MVTCGEVVGNQWEIFELLNFCYCNYYQKGIRKGSKASHKIPKVEYNWSMHGEPLRQ